MTPDNTPAVWPLAYMAPDPTLRCAKARFIGSVDQLADAMKPHARADYAASRALIATAMAIHAIRQQVAIMAACGGDDAETLGHVEDHLRDAVWVIEDHGR